MRISALLAEMLKHKPLSFHMSETAAVEAAVLSYMVARKTSGKNQARGKTVQLFAGMKLTMRFFRDTGNRQSGYR